jgi:hypothetical protein
VNLNKLLQLPL